MPGTPGMMVRARAKRQAEAWARYERALTELRTTLPTHERAIVGWPAIHAYLTNVLGVRDGGLRPLSLRSVTRLPKRLGLPVVPGNMLPDRKRCAPPWTSSFLLTAWLLTLTSTAENHSGIRVVDVSTPGK